MRRTAIGTFVALMAGAVIVVAQDAPQQGNAPASSPAQKSSSTTEKSVTYTGCLESGAAPGTYMLSNATEVKQTTTTSQSAAGGAASSAKSTTTSTATAPSFKLTGTPAGFDLAANLNHKIEVTGMISETSSTPEPRTQPQPNEPRTEPQVQSQTKSFSLKTAKSLADRCTELLH
jgi:hypothetical protein